MSTDNGSMDQDRISNDKRKEILDETFGDLKKKSIVYEPIKLHELNAKLIGKYIETECQVIGESNKKAVPTSYSVACQGNCYGWALVDTWELPVDLLLQGKDLRKHIERAAKPYIRTTARNDIQCKHIKFWIDESDDYIDLKTMKVREIIDHTTELNVDLYESYNAYIMTSEVPRTKKVRIKAKVFVEQKGSSIALMINHIEPIEEEIIKLTEQDVVDLNYYFKENEKLDQDIDGLIGPGIFGRYLAKEAALLTLFSPLQIPDGSRGIIHTAFVGDSKCAKSEIARVGCVEILGIGDEVIVETAGRTGMVYTIDTDAKILIWGKLPNNDGGFVVLDGLQRMGSVELGEFREVLESGLIHVTRSVSGDAPARVRLIACLNPKSPMIEYMYRCEALKDSNCFEDEPDITRWDYFVFFSDDDVDIKTICRGKVLETNIPEELFKKKLHWVWSRTKEQIIFTDEANEKINDYVERLMKKFATPRVPVVHNGSKRVLIRTAIAKANKYNSITDDFESILVLPEHVEEAFNFLDMMYDQAELSEMKRKEFERVNVTDEDMLLVASNERYPLVLGECAFGFCASPKLAKILDVSVDTIKNDIHKLGGNNLLYSKSGRGSITTSKGKRLLKKLKQGWGNNITPTNQQIYTNTKKNQFEKKINSETVRVLEYENYSKSNNNDNYKIKKIVKEFIKMSSHPNFIDKYEYTLDDILTYFGTTMDQIKYQCRQLNEFDPNKFILLEDKFRINRK